MTDIVINEIHSALRGTGLTDKKSYLIMSTRKDGLADEKGTAPSAPMRSGVLLDCGLPPARESPAVLLYGRGRVR